MKLGNMRNFPLPLLLLLQAVAAIAAAKPAVFQGSCGGEGSWVCEQVCLDGADGDVFSCDCRPRFRLLEDGASCRSLTSHIHDAASEIVRQTPPPPPSSPAPSPSQLSWSFNGRSYAGFPTPTSAYLATNVTLRLKPAGKSSKTRLVLWAGQRRGRDFLSVTLRDDLVVLRFDCGEGAVEETYQSQALSTAGLWHGLRLSRHFCDAATISLEEEAEEGLRDRTTLTHYKGVSMASTLYLGGVPEELKEHVFQKSLAEEFFEGCVALLSVNEALLLDTETFVDNSLLKEKLG